MTNYMVEIDKIVNDLTREQKASTLRLQAYTYSLALDKAKKKLNDMGENVIQLEPVLHPIPQSFRLTNVNQVLGADWDLPVW